MKWFLLFLIIALVIWAWYLLFYQLEDKPKPFIGTIKVYDKKSGDDKLVLSWNIWEGDTECNFPMSRYRMEFEAEN